MISDVLRQIKTEGGRTVLHFLLNEASLFYPYCKLQLEQPPVHLEVPQDLAPPLYQGRREQRPILEEPQRQQLSESLRGSPGVLAPIWRTETSTILFGCVFTRHTPDMIDPATSAETFQRLVRAITLGLSNYFQQETLRIDKQVLIALVSAVDGPAVLITAEGDTLAHTTGAVDVLVAHDIVERHGSKLVLKNKQVEDCLQALISGAPPTHAPNANSVQPSRSVYFTEPDSVLKRVSIRKVPNPRSGRAGDAWYLLRVSAPEEIPEEVERLLQKHHDLSHSEARLARYLTLTGSMNDTVDRLGITRNTAKTHLRRIYEKTGVHTQLELAGVVYRLSGLF
ncbi:hypothetical protein FMN50_16465 [Rhodobacterales bacterium]|nr:hypothetical protein FMN50_16465 [Rhodobacterales bacterium]